MMEIWKDIEGYEGLYQVSNLGRVKSLERQVNNGKSFRIIKTIILKPRKDSNGYLRVNLYKERVLKTFLLHRLVACAFIHKSEKEVNHIDGNKENNSHINLEFCLPIDNITHAIKLGLIKQIGSNNGNSKLTESDISVIKHEPMSVRDSDLAKKYNVSTQTIYNIRNGKSWKHV